jgi:hypothetical protein
LIGETHQDNLLLYAKHHEEESLRNMNPPTLLLNAWLSVTTVTNVTTIAEHQDRKWVRTAIEQVSTLHFPWKGDRTVEHRTVVSEVFQLWEATRLWKLTQTVRTNATMWEHVSGYRVDPAAPGVTNVSTLTDADWICLGAIHRLKSEISNLKLDGGTNCTALP